MKKRILCAVFFFGISLFFLIILVSAANNWYVSPTGLPTGNGSINNPWNLTTALQDNTLPSNKNFVVKPGDTIWLRGGIYKGVFDSYLTGSPTNPIIVRNYNNERATLSAFSTIRDKFALYIRGKYVWWWGLEIVTDQSMPLTMLNENGGGLTAVNAEENKFINLIIHDTSAVGASLFSQSPATELYGTLLYYNGRDESIDSQSLNRKYGYAIYSQNTDPRQKKFIDNILYHQWGAFGTHFYTQAGSVNNLYLEGNVIMDNTLMIGGAGIIANNPVFINNYVYRSYRDFMRESTASVLDFTWGLGGGTTNGQLIGNYFINGWSTVRIPRTGLIMHGNTFNGYLSDGSGYTSTSLAYPNNTYAIYNGNTGLWPPDVVINKVFVRPNRYEPGRAHIIIFNYANASSVSVDISNVDLYTLGTKIGTGSLLNVGDTYEIRDALNFYGNPIATGTYNGGLISIPMTGLTVAAPMNNRVPTGQWAGYPTHTAPKFGTFVLLKTSGSIQPPSDTTPPSRSNGLPSGILPTGTTSTTMSLLTNELSTCKYATTAGVVYTSMINTFSTTGGLTHSTLVSGLANGNIYNYYIKCRDSAGNTNTDDYVVSFSVATAVTYQLTVAKSGTGSGTVSSNPVGITCGADCSENYNSGTIVTLTASPALGSTFAGWSGACSGTGTCTVTMNAVKSVNATFSLTADSLPPIISAITAAGISSSGATISWTTNENADTQVEYGITTAYGSLTLLNTALVTSHSQILSGLSPSTVYHYQIKSKDASGNLATSGDNSFVTITAGNGSSPIGWWKFDETSGTIASDSSGSGNLGTLVNGPQWTSGKIGNAIRVDGVDDYVTTPVSSGLSGSFTISLWANPSSSTTEANALINSWVASYSNYWIFLGGPGSCPRDSSKSCIALYDGTNNPYVNSLSSLPLNSWNHITVVRDVGEDKIKIYFNGQFEAQATDTTTSIPSYSAFIIGRQLTPNRPFNGSIDDVRIYNRALSASEIQELFNYNGGSVPDANPPTRSNGQPSGPLPTGTTSTTMSLLTNEAATCRYAATAGVVYPSMINTFSTTGGLTHSTIVSGLANGNTYTYYVKCRDSVRTNPGYVTVGFEKIIVDSPGNDVRIHLMDLVNESFEVFASSDGVSFVSLGKSTQNGIALQPKTVDFDISAGGLSSAQYIKIVNGVVVPTNNTNDPTQTNEGPDIDSVEVLSCVACADIYASRLIDYSPGYTSNQPNPTVTVPGGESKVLGAPGGDPSTSSVNFDSVGNTNIDDFVVSFNVATAVTYQLTVAKSGTGSGTVSSNPVGITCGADCSENYNSGTIVTLTASPALGSTFAGWSGACSGTGTCTVTMNAVKNVSASFSLTPCTLNSALWSATNVQEGTQVTLSVNGNSTCNGQQFSFNVREDDVLGFSNPVNNNPVSAVMANGVATTVWNAEWQCDGILCILDPAEYSFTTSSLSNPNITIKSSNQLIVTQVPNLPTAPSGLQVTLVGTQATLQWTDTSINEFGFKIERSLLPTSGFVEVASVTGNTYIDPGLVTGTVYYYRVRAFNSVGNSGYSAVVTNDSVVPLLSNGVPSGTLPTQTTSTIVSVTTNEAATCKYATTAGVVYPSMINTFSTTGGLTHSTIVSGLANGNIYNYYIKCRDSAGNTNTDDYVVSFSVAVVTNTLIAPSQLSVVSSSNNQITLQWIDNSNNEAGFKIDKAMSVSGPWSEITTVNGTSYTDGNVGINITYYYRVKAYSSLGESSYSNSVSATTLGSFSGSFVYYIEAESGTITAPMVIGNDSFASNGHYVLATSPNVGTAQFIVTVPTTGNYILWARVLSPVASNDSFFVSVNGGSEDTYDSAEGTWGNNWQWTKINGRGGGVPLVLNPRIFSLVSGQHTITFRARDVGSTLDRIVVTNNLSFVPRDNESLSYQCGGIEPTGSGSLKGYSTYVSSPFTTWTYSETADGIQPCVWKCVSGYRNVSNSCMININYKNRLGKNDFRFRLINSTHGVIEEITTNKTLFGIEVFTLVAEKVNDTEIIRQNAGENKSYIILSNFTSLNNRKSAYVEKTDPYSNGVCIADRAGLLSKSDIISNCQVSRCPGVIDEYTCSVNGSVFIASNLTHSGVIEWFIDDGSSGGTGGGYSGGSSGGRGYTRGGPSDNGSVSNKSAGSVVPTASTNNSQGTESQSIPKKVGEFIQEQSKKTFLFPVLIGIILFGIIVVSFILFRKIRERFYTEKK